VPLPHSAGRGRTYYAIPSGFSTFRFADPLPFCFSGAPFLQVGHDRGAQSTDVVEVFHNVIVAVRIRLCASSGSNNSSLILDVLAIGREQALRLFKESAEIDSRTQGCRSDCRHSHRQFGCTRFTEQVQILLIKAQYAVAGLSSLLYRRRASRWEKVVSRRNGDDCKVIVKCKTLNELVVGTLGTSICCYCTQSYK
jgi:hypothetical protein